MRRLCVVVAALIVALFAVGCGNDDDGNGNGAAEEGLSTVESGVLTVGSDIPFPPFEYREGGELTGFDVELVEEMAQRLDLEVRWVDTALDTYTALEAGNVTAVLFDEPSAVTEAEQREALEVTQTIDTGERYGFAVDPQNPELLSALNDALAEIKED